MAKTDSNLSSALENPDTIKLLVYSLFVFLFVYFMHLGVTTTPKLINERDSLDYHIPIAQSIAENGPFYPPDLKLGLGYYPAIGESILSFFILLGFPLNVFNFLSWVLLFIICEKLAKSYGLDDQTALVFAFSAIALNSVLRLIPTQTVDIWLAVFFLYSLYKLRVGLKSDIEYLKLGVGLGLLIGVKYSGVIFAGVLISVFLKRMILKLTIKRIFYLLFPIVLLGGFWYFRNYYLIGNPIYPGRLFALPQHMDFKLQDVSVFNTLFTLRGGLALLLQSLVSEYLIWPLFYIAAIYVVLTRDSKNEVKLAIVALANLIIYLFLPSYPQNMVSDLRYLFVSIIPLMLLVFVFISKFRIKFSFQVLALFASIGVFTQLQYRPKIIFIWLMALVSAYLYKFKANKISR